MRNRNLIATMKRNIVVTGGASGIGLAMTRKFASEGDRVHVLEIDIEAAAKALEGMDEGSVVVYHCDVSDTAMVAETMNNITKDYMVSVLINNAGIAHVGNVENTTEEDMDRLYAVNVKGIYNCIHALIPHMKEHRDGSIINVASVLSSVAASDRFAYSMTKGAVLTMTLSVAKDYLDYGIRCNSISPARVHTPFVDGFIAKNYPGEEKEMFEKLSKTQPIGRMAKPEEVASFVYYLASKEASFLTGTDYPIDGGFIRLNA